jgi:hypothetical protein
MYIYLVRVSVLDIRVRVQILGLGLLVTPKHWIGFFKELGFNSPHTSY